MSAQPGKFSSLSITNHIATKEIWADGLYERSGKGINLITEMSSLKNKLKEISELEKRINSAIRDLETSSKTVSEPKDGPAGPPGEVGPTGAPGAPGAPGMSVTGKQGPTGIRGKDGKSVTGPAGVCECKCGGDAGATSSETASRLDDLLDVDCEDVQDGDVLIYDADSGKFVFGSLE
jgi:hypothetical protein